MTKEEKNKIVCTVNESLDQAEIHWKNGGEELLLDSTTAGLEHLRESIPSKIPNHPFIEKNKTIVDDLIAFVVDIRNSTDHLLCEASEKKQKVSMLQRVYYETSALLPALALTVKFKKGRVTEYLGDGVLAFFSVNKNEQKKSVISAFQAAKNTIISTKPIVDEILNERYSLPELNIGIGLAYSKTLITLIGLENEKHPTAFGECVFRATKLSHGTNKIFIDDKLRAIWPKNTSGGGLTFTKGKKKESIKFDYYNVPLQQE